ncbi:MAG: hypothetical protein ABFR65_09775 [Pseudomonadota bacterium]
MLKIITKLRIGEKIGLGFALVGLLFLAVVWQYHATYSQSLFNYQQLHSIDEVRKSDALKIANSLHEARVAEKRFLIQRDEASIIEVDSHIKDANGLVTELSAIDNSTRDDASRMAELLQTYHEHFLSVVDAWKTKGLDHDSGLQGAFRKTVHELESIAGQFNSGPLYLQLLQIRRAEKGLDLEREEQYRIQLLPLVDDFEQLLTDSRLKQAVKSELLKETETYRDAIERYAQTAVTEEEARTGKGQGQYQLAAGRMEAVLNRYYVADFETNILQLRRREKDYLLRHDQRYVAMALEEIEHINDKIDISLITDEDKKHIKVLMDRYQRDFLALIEQNDRIDQLIERMGQTVESINQLVQLNVIAADQAMHKGFSDVNAASEENKRLMYWSVAAATLLAIGCVVFLTLSIARPLRTMVGLLDKLAYEEPMERMPFDPSGRDEVNAMAISLNTMADHQKRFIDWWKTSMAEEDACEKLKRVLRGTTNEIPGENLAEVSDELKTAIFSKKGLFSTQCQGIEQLSSTITERADELLRNKPSGDTLMALDSIRHSAQAIKNFLEVVSVQETQKRRAF